MKFFIILLSLFAFVCNPDLVPEQKAEITGMWLWTQSSGGFAGQVITPDKNVKHILKFSLEGNYSEYNNDTLKFLSTFTLGKDKTIYSVDSLEVLMIKNYQNEKLVILKLTKDSLTLADNYYDGFQFNYVRVEY